MEDFRRNPFFKITVPLLFGVIFQYLSLSLSAGEEGVFRSVFAGGLQFSGLLFIAFFLVSLTVLHIFKVHRRYSAAWLYGLHYYLIFFFLGISLVQLNPLHTTVPLNEENYFELLVTENPENTDRAVRMDVKIRAFSADGQRWTKCDERSIIYTDKDSTVKFSPGDVLLCQAVFNEVAPPQNSGEFDYREYLRRKRIFSTSFVNSEKMAVTDSGQINFYKKFVFSLQRYSLETLQKAGLKSDELAVALALLTGNKQYLEDELRDSYVAAGTVHLLAVSGLHVGIVFMVLNFVFRFMDRQKKLRLLKGFIILVSLWIYASVAGLASSIVRASVMFSIFVIADMAGKSGNTYNNISLSCFIMCLANPYVIFDTGFQLSYLAVLGIVYFQPKFMRPFRRCNRFIKPVIECTTVTLSAQLGTLPVILLTFKQFPAYFIFSNLILVPYTSVVMYIGLTVIVLSWQSFLLSISGLALGFSTGLMNRIVRFFDSLPYSTVEGIYINGTQCTLLVICILSLAFLLSFRKRIFAAATLISLIGIFAVGAFHSYEISSHKEFGVFGVKRAFYAYFIENGTGFSIRDTASVNRSFDFNTKNSLIRRGFRSEQDLTGLSLDDSIPNLYRGVLLFAGKRIALSSRLHVNANFSGTPMNVDYLYVTERQKTEPETVLSCYNPSKIIIANNMPASIIDKWIKIAESKKIPYHNIKTGGGFSEIVK
ncbi:MAG: ComEC family competence protein [Prevotellaceae bacterium]|jgi:competence protein ComEC|nr:ComEC family competence protein [Prevotellaceae bacterium]